MERIASNHAQRIVEDIVSEITLPLCPNITPDCRITLEEIVKRRLKEFTQEVRLPAAARAS